MYSHHVLVGGSVATMSLLPMQSASFQEKAWGCLWQLLLYCSAWHLGLLLNTDAPITRTHRANFFLLSYLLFQFDKEQAGLQFLSSVCKYNKLNRFGRNQQVKKFPQVDVHNWVRTHAVGTQHRLAYL